MGEKKRSLAAPFHFLLARLQAVVLLKLNRMSSHTQTRNFFHLQCDVSMRFKLGDLTVELCQVLKQALYE